MSVNENDTELLFAYGTLQTEAVQRATFGRTLAGTPAALPRYRLQMTRIEDADFVAASGTAVHRNLEFTGDPADTVEGTVFKVTQAELEHSDAYEPDGYQRTLVQTQSGLTAWVYLQQSPSTTDPY